jgi:glutaredoxin 3
MLAIRESMRKLQIAMSSPETPRAEVVMYRTRYCPYCVFAARFLAKKGVTVREIDVSSDPDCRDWLVRVTGMLTVPQIFINGRSVRGFDDIVALDRRGLLDPLLAEPPDSAHAPAAECGAHG